MMPLKTVVLDIETVPNGAALERLEVTRPTASPPSGEPAASPKWVLQQVIAACVLVIEKDANKPLFEMRNWHVGSQPEMSIVAEIDAALDGVSTLLTCNGRGHDLPILRARAMAARSLAVPRIAGLMARKAVRHVDLLDELSGRTASRPSLAEIAALLGLPAKAEVARTSVPALAAAGEFECIIRHCESNVVATYLAHLHLAMSDSGSDHCFRTGAEGLAAWLEGQTCERPHLQAYRHVCQRMAAFEAVDAAPPRDLSDLNF